MNLTAQHVQARSALFAERERLVAARSVISNEIDTDEAVPQDKAEVADALGDRTDVTSELDRIEEDLVEIIDALLRIDDGSFGHCQVCGELIPKERLQAVPTARRCVPHQQQMESRSRHLDRRHA
jgi:DnaK suppressor protein